MGFHLFQAFGVELEYMLVDRGTLDIRPVADKVLKYAATLPAAEVLEESDGFPSEVRLGPVSLSNELAAHVIELKVAEPAHALAGLDAAFQHAVRTIHELAAGLNACLLPTGMHPWMEPARESTLWPHGHGDYYAAFNRIFDCRGHGWTNLQAVHLNLPFEGDEQFGRLHAAIRALLPILPTLTASSPVMEGRLTGLLDNRVDVYRHNCRRVPSVTGRVIPEPVFSHDEYQLAILGRIYADMRPLDPEGLLAEEWINARGCIARFSRGAIEIRVMDVQECPAADLAICGGVSAVLRALALRSPADLQTLRSLDTAALESILLAVIRDGDRAVISDRDYLRALGWPTASCSAGDLWRDLLGATARGVPGWESWRPWLETILTRGCLARRITDALAGEITRPRLAAVYRQLQQCLEQARPFTGGPPAR